jgi:prefoldin subunit 5
MALRGLPSKPGFGKKNPVAPITSNVVKEVQVQVAVPNTFDVTIYLTQIANLQSSLTTAQNDLLAALAQETVDAATIAALQGQVTTLTGQVNSLSAQVSSLTSTNASQALTITSLNAQVDSLNSQITTLNAQVSSLTATNSSQASTIGSLNAQLSKIFKVVLIDTYSIIDGGIYVPPVFSDVTIDYASVTKLNAPIINTYATTGGGYP